MKICHGEQWGKKIWHGEWNMPWGTMGNKNMLWKRKYVMGNKIYHEEWWEMKTYYENEKDVMGMMGNKNMSWKQKRYKYMSWEMLIYQTIY